MFTIGKLYKHVDNRDVVFQLLDTPEQLDDGSFRLSVMWYNIGPHPIYCMGLNDTIRIHNGRIPEWKIYNP